MEVRVKCLLGVAGARGDREHLEEEAEVRVVPATGRVRRWRLVHQSDGVSKGRERGQSGAEQLPGSAPLRLGVFVGPFGFRSSSGVSSTTPPPFWARRLSHARRDGVPHEWSKSPCSGCPFWMRSRRSASAFTARRRQNSRTSASPSGRTGSYLLSAGPK